MDFDERQADGGVMVVGFTWVVDSVVLGERVMASSAVLNGAAAVGEGELTDDDVAAIDRLGAARGRIR